MSAVPAHLRAKGWSEAKAFAATMLRKNPNTYFYRHVAPHETQVRGPVPPVQAAADCWQPVSQPASVCGAALKPPT